MNRKVDAIDRKILELLMQDGRMSYAEIGRIVHLSRVSVRDRIKQMEEDGVIEQYTAVVNRHALGLDLAVFLEIEVLPSKMETVAKAISEMDETAIVYQMTGPTVLHVHLFVENDKKLSQLLNEKIYPLDGIVSTSVYMLLKDYKTKLNIK